MTRDSTNPRIDEVLQELEGFELPDLIFAASRCITHTSRDTEAGLRARRKFAAATIAAHYVPTYRFELLRANHERESLGDECAALWAEIRSLQPASESNHAQLLQRADLAANRFFAQFHLMAITTSMLRRLVLREAAPFSCEGRLSDANLKTLDCYEQLRDNMEHFDERLPGEEHQDWMTKEEVTEGYFRIIHRLPDAGNGRITLNGVEMEFSSRQVEQIVTALDQLQDQIRSAALRDVKRHLRRNPEDIPTQVERLRYFEHTVMPIT